MSKKEESLVWKAMKNERDGITFYFKGKITESARFDLLKEAFAELEGKNVEVNLRYIDSLNSSGISKWMDFIKFLKEKNISILLKECSIDFIAQINMIEGFTGGNIVQSFYAPFVCDSCDNKTKELALLPDSPIVASIRLGTGLKCLSCGKEKFFDDIAETYLGFLSE